jgi:hypothetical protein
MKTITKLLCIILGLLFFTSCATPKDGCFLSQGFVGEGGQHPAGMRH